MVNHLLRCPRKTPQARAKVGFVPDVRFETADPSVVFGLVNAGLGLAIVQESLNKAREQGVVLRPLPKSFSLRTQIFMVARADVRPLMSRFLACQRA